MPPPTNTTELTDDERKQRREKFTDTTIHLIIVTVVGIVAAIAAIVSYRHMQHLAEEYEGALSYLYPILVDGMIIVGTLVLVDRRRKQLPPSGLAWTAVGLGVLASLASNAAGAKPGLAAHLIAAWAPAALGICLELLLVQLQLRSKRTTQRTGPVLAANREADQTGLADGPDHETRDEDPTRTDPDRNPDHRTTGPPDHHDTDQTDEPLPTPRVLEILPRPSQPHHKKPSRKPTRVPLQVRPDRTDADILTDLRTKPDRPSRNSIVRDYGVGATRATRILTQLGPTELDTGT